MMGIAGAGFGASKALEEILGAQMLRAQMAQRQKEAADRLALDQARLSQDATEADARIKQGQQRIELDDRERRDRNNARGLDLMKADKTEMDTETALTTLPDHLKPIAGLMKIGALRNLSPDDLQSPEQKEADAKAAEAREIRIRQASRPPTQAPERKPLVVKMPDGTVKDLNNVLPDGAVLYDPVAARSSKPENDKEAVDTAREAKRLATNLLNSKGFNGAFGVVDSWLPTFRQDTADAEIIRESLKNLLTMENMDKMKGVLSDSDMKVLKSASTTLEGKMSETAARAELNRIVQVMGKVGGDAPDPKDGSGDVSTGDEVDAMIERLRGRPKGK